MSVPLPDAAHPARLTIDLGALAANWRSMKALAPASETAAVVKADAYGIGVEPAVRALAAAGCMTFFVATLPEAETVRRLARTATIYVLDGLIAGDAPRYGASDLRPILGSPQEVAEWAAWRRDGGTTLAAIQIDTGMNRQGLSLDEAEAVAADAALMDALRPALVMSHLACADEPETELNGRQLEAFSAILPRFPGVAASLSNSAGIQLGQPYQFDLTRPGIALYGGRSVAGRPALTPVVTAEARVLRVRDAPAGKTVGYGARETLKRDSRLAVLAAGYADGYVRAAGSPDAARGASVFIRGKAAPLVGRVSMDLMVADVTGIPGVTRGDWAELFGHSILVDDVADHAGTIGYELLTALGSRYHRSYLGLG